MSDTATKENARRAKSLFDQITEASYLGMAFRLTLATNPEAMQAAQTLIDALKKDGMTLTTPDYQPK